MLSCDSLISLVSGLYLVVSGIRGLRQGSFSFRTKDIFSSQRLPVEGKLARFLACIYVLCGIGNLGTLILTLVKPDQINLLFSVVVLTVMAALFTTFICLGLQQVKEAARQLHRLRTRRDR